MKAVEHTSLNFMRVCLIHSRVHNTFVERLRLYVICFALHSLLVCEKNVLCVLGYFIVNYDETNWRNLARLVMSFPPAVRAQLITDSMDLARAGLLDYNIPLQIVTNMATQDREIALVPTIAAFDKLTYLYNMIASTPAFGKFNVS